MTLRVAFMTIALLGASPVRGQQAAPTAAAPAGPAASRFPQPVRVGDLVGRQVLRPVEAQNVLGRVAAVARGPDGAVLFVLDVGGVLGFGTRRVAVPAGAVALLGEHVSVLDLTPAQLRALPGYDPASAPALGLDEVIRVGLTRPFH